MRIVESGLLAGIPVFGYFVGIEFAQDVNYLSVLRIYIASFFCALSVFSIGEIHRGNFHLKISFIFIALSIFTTFTEVTSLFFLPAVIYANWCLYYFLRRRLYFADIVLHFTGGMLQFFFGFWVATKRFEVDPYSFFMSLLPALAFTGGYITDLIQDIQEDKSIGQKNVAEKIGINFAMALSVLLFGLAYAIALLSIEKFKILVLINMILHVKVFSVFYKKKNFVFYRNFYRLSFIIIGIVWSVQKFL